MVAFTSGGFSQSNDSIGGILVSAFAVRGILVLWGLYLRLTSLLVIWPGLGMIEGKYSILFGVIR